MSKTSNKELIGFVEAQNEILKKLLDSVKTGTIDKYYPEFIKEMLVITQGELHPEYALTICQNLVLSTRINVAVEGIYNNAIEGKLDQCFINFEQEMLAATSGKIYPHIVNQFCKTKLNDAKKLSDDFNKALQDLYRSKIQKTYYEEKQEILKRIIAITKGKVDENLINNICEQQHIKANRVSEKFHKASQDLCATTIIQCFKPDYKKEAQNARYDECYQKMVEAIGDKVIPELRQKIIDNTIENINAVTEEFSHLVTNFYETMKNSDEYLYKTIIDKMHATTLHRVPFNFVDDFCARIHEKSLICKEALLHDQSQEGYHDGEQDVDMMGTAQEDVNLDYPKSE